MSSNNQTLSPSEMSAKLKKYRLSSSEFDLICSKLGREPNNIEWALFSALWSEHCSYKSSKVHLKGLFRDSKRVLESFGENAGVVDLGEGERIAFKMESHNHPSFIEPYQGAATGVGGILRDIFTMGARPIALANYLCFGDPKADRMTALVDGVVRGIAGYGNCVGVPNISGQTEFHESYNKNILVNAFALGYFGKNDKVFLSKAKGKGFYVVYVGAKTGRDGIHGASMASESFTKGDESKRPTIQIGDPFFEKLLIESCLEVMKMDLVAAIQDMGAAGLTSSSFEMASKGGVGLTLNLDQVPLRDSTLTPEDILLSESQERMLLICEPEKFDKLVSVFSKWGLDATRVGEVTDSKKVKICWKGETLTEIDPDILVEEAPVYNREFKKEVMKDWAPLPAANLELREILKSPQGTSRKWIYRQYDQRVGARTARDCSNSIGVVRLPESGRALGVVLGARPYILRRDARLGGWDAVMHPSLELALKGFTPLAITDCLNFGNPEKPEIMTQFVSALAGMNEACKELDAPIISGNVSFYNESDGKNITPTPSVGVVGLRNDLEHIPGDDFSKADLDIWLVSSHSHDSKVQAKWIKEISCLSYEKGVLSTRAVGKFGLGYALARMAQTGVGAEIKFSGSLTEERLYECVFVTDRNSFKGFGAGIRSEKIGTTGGQELKLSGTTYLVKELIEAYNTGWSANFESLS